MHVSPKSVIKCLKNLKLCRAVYTYEVYKKNQSNSFYLKRNNYLKRKCSYLKRNSYYLKRNSYYLKQNSYYLKRISYYSKRNSYYLKRNSYYLKCRFDQDFRSISKWLNISLIEINKHFQLMKKAGSKSTKETKRILSWCTKLGTASRNVEYTTD